MISVKKAREIVSRESNVLGEESVEMSRSLGRVLAENINADTDLPPFDRSQMDGYAVIAKDTTKAPVELRIVGESAAGNGWRGELKKGEAVRIMTGAPVPKGADAVQKVELTGDGFVPFRNGGTSGTGISVTLLEPTKKGRFIIRKGHEIRKGANVFSKGEFVTSNMIASIAAFGYSDVCVAKRPTIAILGTGSEIVEIDQVPGADQIRNSNSVMLKAFCGHMSERVTIYPIVRDRIADLKNSISSAARKNDIVVITGGVSVGKYDYTKAALAEIGAKIYFDQIALKPGKPTVFAKLGDTFIFGLPGNPVSAAVTFQVFVRQLIMRMQGAAHPALIQGFAVLGAIAKGTKDRETYLPSMLDTDRTGRLIATPVRWLGSSDFVGFGRSEALIVVPPATTLESDAVVKVLML
jgi:molybdopterin molybdotransferase